MKIKDFAKVSDFGSELEVVIIEERKSRMCDGTHEAYELEDWDYGCEKGCISETCGVEACEHCIYGECRERLYEGCCDNIPLKLSDKTIKRIEFKHEHMKANSRRCSCDIYLYIFVKGVDEPK
jgi:hypothetical protein